jgi:hypothetical protein
MTQTSPLPLFEMANGGIIHTATMAACGEQSPGHPNLRNKRTGRRMPLPRCNRPAGHADDHAKVRKRDFHLLASWTHAGEWVVAPAKAKV